MLENGPINYKTWISVHFFEWNGIIENPWLGEIPRIYMLLSQIVVNGDTDEADCPILSFFSSLPFLTCVIRLKAIFSYRWSLRSIFRHFIHPTDNHLALSPSASLRLSSSLTSPTDCSQYLNPPPLNSYKPRQISPWSLDSPSPFLYIWHFSFCTLFFCSMSEIQRSFLTKTSISLCCLSSSQYYTAI